MPVRAFNALNYWDMAQNQTVSQEAITATDIPEPTEKIAEFDFQIVEL